MKMPEREMSRECAKKQEVTPASSLMFRWYLTHKKNNKRCLHGDSNHFVFKAGLFLTKCKSKKWERGREEGGMGLQGGYGKQKILSRYVLNDFLNAQYVSRCSANHYETSSLLLSCSRHSAVFSVYSETNRKLVITGVRKKNQRLKISVLQR